MPFFGGGGGAAASNMVGATSSAAGTAGLVPAPAAGKNTRYLASDANFGELPLLPQYKNSTASRYICCVAESYSANTGGVTIKVRNFALMYVPADGQIDMLSFKTGSAPSPAFNVNLSLWQCNEDGTVGSYVIGGNGSTGTSGSTTINISVAATSVVRGYYWISFTPDATHGSTPINFCGTNSCTFFSRFLGSTDVIPNTNVVWWYTCNTSYDQTTHETFTLNSSGSGVGARIPMVAFQYV